MLKTRFLAEFLMTIYDYQVEKYPKQKAALKECSPWPNMNRTVYNIKKNSKA